MQEFRTKLFSVVEDLIVVIVMFGVFLPVRVVFYNYISNDWLGSFGLISIIVLIMVYLSKKQKLGWFGRAYWKSITRVHKGKRRIISYLSLSIMLYFWGSMIFGVNFAQTNQEAIELRIDALSRITPEEQAKLDAINNAVSNKDIVETHNTLMRQFQQIPTEQLIVGVILLFFFPIIDFVAWSVIASLLDGFLDGWILHFGTIFFIESLEVLGILIYTYIQTKKPNIPPS